MNNNYCFCTLALGKRYRDMAGELACDIEKHAPGIKFVVLTDKPADLAGYGNVLAFKHSQQGIFSCYNDKRFVIEKALSLFNTAIHIDADSKVIAGVPSDLEFLPGISGCSEGIITHLKKTRPERLPRYEKVAAKIGVSIESAQWIGESLWIITKDAGKENEFIRHWNKITSYLELHGINDGEGNVMGLAAAKAGWQARSEEWQKLKGAVTHQDASDIPYKRSFLDKQVRRIRYHWRLNKARLLALKDFNFYYR
jgi:hypothetical protein